MKKSILFLAVPLAVSAILFSCKKDDKKEFTQTDVTGTTVVRGNVNKNIISPDGNGNWSSNNKISAAGIQVSVKVNKGGSQGLYPNSTANGADVYSATTDANGNYAITVRSNATGVLANITIEGFTGTLDTIINGNKKTGLYATYFGTNTTRTLIMGQNITLDHSFVASNVSSNPNNIVIGTAIVTGSVNMSWVRKVLTGTVVSTSFTNVPVPANTTVFLTFDKDPTLLSSKVYQTTTDASGSYTFNVNTVAMGTAGFNQDANVWVPDFAARRDTLNFVGSTPSGTLNGLNGVFGQASNMQFGIYSSNIRNAVNISYNAFTPN